MSGSPGSWRTFLAACLVAAVVGACSGSSGGSPRGSAPEIQGQPGTAVIHEAGWSTPIKLRFNDDGWEDSPYITRDGRRILFFYHPFPDLITKLDEVIASGIDGKIYTSERPFTAKAVHPISTPDPATECCAYLSESGQLFYTSNQESFDRQLDLPEKIYVDGRRIDLGTGGEEANPHYCDARDELWFDCPGDTEICLLRDAVAHDFSGTPVRVPAPINLERSDDSQPYLTDDCETLYFTRSDHGGADRPEIFVSTLQSDGGWSEPALFLSHPSGVGEVSITADGNELIFAQIFDREEGGVGIDIYYSKRTE